MKKYITIDINNFLEKESIELIWDLIFAQDISSFSLITIKLEDNTIKSLIFENEYEKIEKKCGDNKIKMRKIFNKLRIYNQQDFLLMSE